jgi:tetratricopeptide (TPR) repeat protein
MLLTGLLAALLLASCGSAPQRPPVALEQARAADKSAHRAMRDGDLVWARELFAQSLALQQSLDNLAGSAIAMINLATVSHRLDDDAAALRLLDRILADGALSYPAELRAAAAFRKAVILADIGRPVEAESALALAAKECAQPCKLRPGMDNLRARLELLKGNTVAALELAKQAMVGAEKEELANAWRISASAGAALGQHGAALAHYQAALELDKELGLSARIAEDLNGVALMLRQLGRKEEAEGYARRAAAVIEAARLGPVTR